MASRPPPTLPDELVEEILVRIPPDDPARLVHAAVACKRWCRLVSGPAFRRRFRERHRTPPVLGIISTIFDDDDNPAGIRFIPTCSFRPRHAVRRRRRGWMVHHSRHGRVLLYARREHYCIGALAVWNPVTDNLQKLPALPQYPDVWSFNAAVLCTAATRGDCDHLDCSSGPFLVAVVADCNCVLSTFVYSSEADAWSEPSSCTTPHHLAVALGPRGGAHVGNALYFVLYTLQKILEYNLGTREMILIDPPPMTNENIWIMTSKGGLLGCAMTKKSRLTLWYWEADPDGDMRWTQNKVIQLEELLPMDHSIIKTIDVVGFADGGVVVYVDTNRASFIIDLKSRLRKRLARVHADDNIVLMGFCIPALRVAFTGEGPGADTSSS